MKRNKIIQNFIPSAVAGIQIHDFMKPVHKSRDIIQQFACGPSVCACVRVCARVPGTSQTFVLDATQQKRQHLTLKTTGPLDYIRGVFEKDGCLK